MLEVLSEANNIFLRNLTVKINGLKVYSGNDEQICRQIILDCYNSKKQYFMASNGNYKVFYSRDFGWCIQSLINLGYKKQVDNTLKYAIEIYSKHNNITVAINNNGMPFNFPQVYSPDSVAYFYRSLRILKNKKLIQKYIVFLNNQLKIFELKVLTANGMLKNDHFSGMRDHIKDKELCYDMIMACMLCEEIDKINQLMRKELKGKDALNNILKKYPLKKILIAKYWNGEYFVDNPFDRYCSGHANTYSYFLDVIKDTKMLRSSIKNIQKNNLDKPLPIKYGYSNDTRFIWQELFAPNWEKNTSWTMLGMAYIDIVSKIDKELAKYYLNQYADMIIKNKCFIEVYIDKKPYNSLFFTSDDSMLWASMYLDLKKRLITKKLHLV